MNRIFKVIYSKTKHMYVVASELAKSHSKSKNEGTPSGKALAALVMAALASVSFMAAPMTAEALVKTRTDGSGFIGVERRDGTFADSDYANNGGAGANGENSITIGLKAIAADELLLVTGMPLYLLVVYILVADLGCRPEKRCRISKTPAIWLHL